MKKLCVILGIIFGLMILILCSICVLSSPDDFAELGIVRDTSVSSDMVYSSRIVGDGWVITAEIDNQIYSGAKSSLSHKYPLFPESKEYRLKLIFDSHQEELMCELVDQFRGIQFFENLNGNEYVDLIISYVQNIPKREVRTLYPNYPLVTVIDERGTTEEKALLLAGMLAYSGYDVVLLDFPEEHNHVAVGIKNNCPQRYQQTDGYAVIEVSPLGWNVGQTEMTTNADVMKVGNGTAVYVFGTYLN